MSPGVPPVTTAMRCAACTVPLLLSGCGLAPSVNILGSFFPAWLISIVTGVVLTVLVRQVFVATKLAPYLRPAGLVYPWLASRLMTYIRSATARELYFWSLVVALMLFGVGGGVSVYEGLRHAGGAPRDPFWSYVVLAVAFAAEGTSFVIALREFRRRKGSASWWGAFRASKDPHVFVPLAEDTAALVGIAIAAVGIFLSHRLGIRSLDAVSSVLIGLTLGAVAVVLAAETRGLLIGERANEGVVRRIREAALQDPVVLAVHHVVTLHVGPDAIVLNLGVDVRRGESVEDVAAAIERLEGRSAARTGGSRMYSSSSESLREPRRCPRTRECRCERPDRSVYVRPAERSTRPRRRRRTAVARRIASGRQPAERRQLNMIELKSDPLRRTVFVQMRGQLTTADYAQFIPELERLIAAAQGKIRILLRMHDFHGWTAGALWEDVKFDVKHFGDIERLAMVGDRKWEAAMATFCKPFTTAEIRYFDERDLDAARRWIDEGAGGHAAAS